jgi:hypothetical protein
VVGFEPRSPPWARELQRFAISFWSTGLTPRPRYSPSGTFGGARLEAAATRAIEIGVLTYGSIRSILDHKLPIGMCLIERQRRQRMR